MKYMLKRRAKETLHGILHVKDGSRIPFRYSEETPRRYEEYNQFIQGMDFIMASATISTTTALNISYGDKITLDSGLTLTVKNFQPVTNYRKAMYSKNSVERWIIDLR